MFGVSERRACKVLGHPRSTHRYEPIPGEDEQGLTEEIVELASRYGRYGYRRVTALLRMEGWDVNHKRVERIWTGLKTRLHQIGLRQIVAGMRYVPPPGAVGSASKGEGQSSRTDQVEIPVQHSFTS